jgi:Domain of Unknown Function (DUF748)
MRRRWIWLLGALGLLGVLTYGIARYADEPVRRYLEHEVNQRLTGYTVRIPSLRLHPWMGSIELLDATIVQDAKPDPPVTHIARLVTSIDWRALLHRRLVADITFDRPTLHLDLENVRTEAASDVALKDRGWQEALEALAFDLKINRLRVLEGDVTYVDRGPFKPLHVSRLNLSAENIRNVRSKERVYPSEIHVEGVLFETGSVWLDGHADFLAEPHPGLAVALRLDQVGLDYFKPLTDRYNVSVDRGTLSLAGSMEYAPKVTRLILDQVLVQGAALEYRHLPRTAEAEQARARQTVQAAQQVAGKTDTELRIDRLDIVKSTFGFANHAATPPYRLVLTDTDLAVRHLGNQRASEPASVRITGQLMGRGRTDVTATLEPRTGSADMDLTAQIEEADLARLRELVRAYGRVDVTAGVFSVYTELQMKRGMVTGYVKPLFRDVEVGSEDGAAAEKGFRQRLYEGMVGVATKVLKNRPRREVATVIPISGPVDKPRLARWDAVGGLLRNAFIEAIEPGYASPPRPKRAAPPPSSSDEGRARALPEPEPRPDNEAP